MADWYPYVGTAAVAVGGLYASTRVTGKTFADHKIMFVGAGEAAIGIADLCCKAMEADGIPQDVIYLQIIFIFPFP